MNHAKKILNMVLVPNSQPSKILKPGEHFTYHKYHYSTFTEGLMVADMNRECENEMILSVCYVKKIVFQEKTDALKKMDILSEIRMHCPAVISSIVSQGFGRF